MSAPKGNDDASYNIRRLAGLVGEIGDAVIIGLNAERDRYGQEKTQIRYRQAFKALQDASDNMRWIVKNELNLLAGRARLIKRDISNLVTDFVAQESPRT